MRPPPSQTLSSRVLRIARLTGVINAVTYSVMVGVSLGLTLTFAVDVWTGGIAMVGVFLLFFVYQVIVRPPLYARYWRYEVGEHDVYLQRGLFVVARELIPFARVQNVDTSQGPMERFFKVSSVKLSTAGSSVVIPMLDDEVAEALRLQISERARSMRGGHAG